MARDGGLAGKPARRPLIQPLPRLSKMVRVVARRGRNRSLRTRRMQNERDAVKLNLICLVDVAINQMSTPPLITLCELRFLYRRDNRRRPPLGCSER